MALDLRDHLGDVLGDLRIAGEDVTLFEVYTAPFRIELTPGFMKLRSGRWDERDPRIASAASDRLPSRPGQAKVIETDLRLSLCADAPRRTTVTRWLGRTSSLGRCHA